MEWLWRGGRWGGNKPTAAPNENPDEEGQNGKTTQRAGDAHLHGHVIEDCTGTSTRMEQAVSISA
jgi:hypothetical protein